MKFEKITGGSLNTEKEVFEKFPWLETAIFFEAIVNIKGKFLVWEHGTWEHGRNNQPA